MFKKGEEKAKVGRPKLADSELKTQSIIVLIILFITVIIVLFAGYNTLFGTLIYTNTNVNNLKGNVKNVNMKCTEKVKVNGVITCTSDYKLIHVSESSDCKISGKDVTFEENTKKSSFKCSNAGEYKICACDSGGCKGNKNECVKVKVEKASGTTLEPGSKVTSCTAKNDWFQSGSNWYYYDGSCKKVTGWYKISSNWYYFDTSGVMLTGWKQLTTKSSGSTKYWFYLDETAGSSLGKMAIGWKKVKDNWFYFDSDGRMVTGWKELTTSTSKGEKYWFYFTETSGANQGKMVTGWLKNKGNYYYFDSNGYMVTGWKSIKSDNGVYHWFYFDETKGANLGRMLMNEWKQLTTKSSGSTKYRFYFDGNGYMKTGWYKYKDSWYYLRETGSLMGAMVSNTCETISGVYYCFDKDGKLLDETFLKTLPSGSCPIGTAISGVLVSGSNTKYDTSKVKISINTSTLSSTELSNLYLVVKPYNADKVWNYTINGTAKTEKIGDLNTVSLIKIADKFTKESNGYTTTLDVKDYKYTTLYSGSNKCYSNAFIKDGYNINSYQRTYILSEYNILTENGVLNGDFSGLSVTSSDNKVFRVNSKNNYKSKSLKATSQDAKNGSESDANKTATLTYKAGNLTGSFKTRLPDRYWETQYLLNPLTGKIDDSYGKVDKLSRTTYTKNSNGDLAFGKEISTKEGSNVYSMDSGTVTLVRDESDKDGYGKMVQVTMSFSDTSKYVLTYAHLKTINVKNGDRVYKGQLIGTVGKTAEKGKSLSNPLLFVSLSTYHKDGYKALLIDNFIGRDIPYTAATSANYTTFQKWIEDKDLCKYSPYGDICNDSKSTESDDGKTVVITEDSETTSPTKSDDDGKTVTTTGGSNTTTTTKSNDGTCSIPLDNRKPGDVNCDGKVSETDATLILMHRSGKIIITDKNLVEANDLNEDKNVSETDATIILRYRSGKIGKICNNYGKCITN